MGRVAVILVFVVALGLGGIYAWTNAMVGKSNRKVDSRTRAALAVPVPVGPGVPTTEPPRPGSMNILLLGSDSRPGSVEKYGRSDTLILAHLDPSANYVSVLPLPRDLRIKLAGHGTQKINAAYAYGGDALAITTVQQLTGLKIDAFVNINFDAFRAVTTALGGIYVDVDRRYFYGGPYFEPINLQPGYERLAGNDALQYVRFRHDANADFGRIDRQQRFLRAVKEQAFQWNSFTRLPSLVSLLADHLTSNLSTREALSLAWWSVKLGSTRVKQVTLRANDEYIGGVAYVVASRNALQTALDELLAPPSAVPGKGTFTSTTGRVQTTGSGGTTATAPGEPDLDLRKVDLTGTSVEVYNASGQTGVAAAAARYLRALGAHVPSVGDAPGPKLSRSAVVYPAWTTATNDSASMSGPAEAAMVGEALGVYKQVEDNSRGRVQVYIGEDFVAPAATGTPTVASVETGQWRYLAGQAKFSLMASAYLPDGFTYAGSRAYDIATDQGPKPSLKVMYRLGQEDQFLGLMQTTFVDAPGASNGEQVSTAGGVFTVVQTGAGCDHVWWRRAGVLYWVSNTLSFRLTKDQLLAVAESMALVR